MADLPEQRSNIQVEETRFRFALSESLMQKMGKSVNFINERHYEVRQFVANGDYSSVTVPIVAADGYTFFSFAMAITDVWAYVQFPGSGGVTEFDIKYATSPGGVFASIFSTTPKITSAAGGGVWINIGGVLAGATAPVLSVTSFAAGTAMRMDLITTQTGDTVNGAGIELHYRPT